VFQSRKKKMKACVAVVLALVVALSSAANYAEEFAGKVALVTGGSSGIGYQTALQFAQNGAKVIIVARDSHPTWFDGQSAADRINADSTVVQTGGSARFFKADVSNRDDVKALFDNITKTENDLHFAVNAAGITGPIGEINTLRSYFNKEHDPVRNNIYGTLYSLMYELRFMNAKNHTGAIVNLASVNGVKPVAKGTLYTTSKFGIVGLTRSVASEHAAATKDMPFIRVNALAPTLTDTSLTWQQLKYKVYGIQPFLGEYVNHDHPLWKQYGPDWIASLTSKHIGSPKNMADSALFLCSSDASFITGSLFLVDRGATA